MNAAQTVIRKFGSQSALALLIGKRQSTVQHWAKTGIVPARWHAEILRLAREHGIDLSPSDLVAGQGGTIDNVPKIPKAKWFGSLYLGGEEELPCYVLEDGRRIISRTGATSVLAGEKGGGQLEKYVSTDSLRAYMPSDLPDRMIDFSIDRVRNKTVKGIEAETFVDICRGYVRALVENKLITESQTQMAAKASIFLAACAKVGIIALIDEATGYQYERPLDALQFKFKLYLEDEMRKWERTFPDELWVEFARLTRYKQVSIHHRPKWWGKLVMELVYDYLDKDVADWLRKNAPKPRHGENYHQWLTSQYGLKKLVEHIWMLIGMASACHSLRELRDKMAERFGRHPVQLTFYLPADFSPPMRNPLPGLDRKPTNEPGENRPK